MIKVIENKHKNLVKPSPHSEILPKHPFRASFSGASHSGKSNLIINLITREEFYNGYFDVIILFSPTAKIDDAWQICYDKNLIKPGNVFDTPDVAKLEAIFEKQSEICKLHGVNKSPRILIILDDIIDNRAFVASATLGKCFYRSRHINISLMVSTQCYNKIPRSFRMNFSNLFIFKPKLSEMKVICDDVCPSNITKKQFCGVINHCCDKPYEFCHLYFEIELEKMIRRGLEQMVNIK